MHIVSKLNQARNNNFYADFPCLLVSITNVLWLWPSFFICLIQHFSNQIFHSKFWFLLQNWNRPLIDMWKNVVSFFLLKKVSWSLMQWHIYAFFFQWLQSRIISIAATSWFAVEEVFINLMWENLSKNLKHLCFKFQLWKRR